MPPDGFVVFAIVQPATMVYVSPAPGAFGVAAGLNGAANVSTVAVLLTTVAVCTSEVMVYDAPAMTSAPRVGLHALNDSTVAVLLRMFRFVCARVPMVYAPVTGAAGVHPPVNVSTPVVVLLVIVAVDPPIVTTCPTHWFRIHVAVVVMVVAVELVATPDVPSVVSVTACPTNWFTPHTAVLSVMLVVVAAVAVPDAPGSVTWTTCPANWSTVHTARASVRDVVVADVDVLPDVPDAQHVSLNRS